MFKKGDHIVIFEDSTGSSFKANFIYKQRIDCAYLKPELDNKDSSKNSWNFINFSIKETYRFANKSEIEEYNRLGKPYDVADLSNRKKEVIHVKNQEEWEYVIRNYMSKTSILYLECDRESTFEKCSSKYNEGMALNTAHNTYCGLNYWKRGGYNIISFEEWCKKYNYNEYTSTSQIEKSKTTTHNIQEIKQKIINDYPIGTTFIDLVNKAEFKVKSHELVDFTYKGRDDIYIPVEKHEKYDNQTARIYDKGVFAEIISKPENEMINDVPKHLSFYVRYTEEFTEDLYTSLNLWAQSNSKGRIRGHDDSYEGLKKHGYYTFDNWGTNTKFYDPAVSTKRTGYGVDNNPQSCKKEHSVEEVKKLIGYVEPFIPEYLEAIDDFSDYIIKGRVYKLCKHNGFDSISVVCNLKCGTYLPEEELFCKSYQFIRSTKEAYDAQVKNDSYKKGDFVVVESYYQCGEGNGICEDDFVTRIEDHIDVNSGIYYKESHYTVKDDCGELKNIKENHIIRLATKQEILDSTYVKKLLEKANKNFKIGLYFKSSFSDNDQIREIKPYYEKDTEINWRYDIEQDAIRPCNGLYNKGLNLCSNPRIYQKGQWCGIVNIENINHKNSPIINEIISKNIYENFKETGFLTINEDIKSSIFAFNELNNLIVSGKQSIKHQSPIILKSKKTNNKLIIIKNK